MAEVTKYRHKAVNEKLFGEALKYIPGGVNSPVRSFKAVGGAPVFVKRASGSKLYGEDGGEYTDYCLSWGAMILGHAHPEVVSNLEEAIGRGTSYGAATELETRLAKLIVGAVPSVEKVRLTSSGTEAVMGAVRLARAYTKRDRIIKFEGAYHGHADYLLTQAVSGVPGDFTKHTVVLPFNDIEKARDAARDNHGKIAAIIVEPVEANCGVILPEEGFLTALKDIADRHGILLIFDEVITGFRVSYGGAQGFFGIEPDLSCLGKIIGGGLPVGAFGGREEIMELLAPSGRVYQAGTLSGNPLAVTAGMTTLEVLKRTDPYSSLAERTANLCEGIRSSAGRYGIDVKTGSIGSMFSVFFTDREVTDYAGARGQDQEMFASFFRGLLNEGVYFSPSAFEANFLSVAHTDEDVEKTLKAVDKVFKNMKE